MKDKEKQSAYMKGWEEYQVKNKQETDKMVRLIQEAVGGCATNWAMLIAEELLEHYQPKLPQDSVVLTREEYENIYEQAEQNVLANIADGGTSCHWCIEQHEKKASKETAENILKDLWAEFEKPVFWADNVAERIKELAKQFSVEIKEN